MPAADAKLFWDAAVDRSVLTAIACSRERTGEVEGVGLHRFAKLVTILRDDGTEQLYASNGIQRLGVMLDRASFLNTPHLSFIIPDDPSMPYRSRTVEKWRTLSRSGKFAKARFEQRAGKWILQLRAFDARQQGASERDIAAAFFPNTYSSAAWQSGGDAVRSAVRRLIATSRQMVAGGYRGLLR